MPARRSLGLMLGLPDLRRSGRHEGKPFYGSADFRDDQSAAGRTAHGSALPQGRVWLATFYKLNARYGGMDLSGAMRLKSLEGETGKLRRLLADAMLDNVVLKGLSEKL